jgi:hypothetical protein
MINNCYMDVTNVRRVQGVVVGITLMSTVEHHMTRYT